MTDTHHTNDIWPTDHDVLDRPTQQHLAEKLLPIYTEILAQEKIPHSPSLLAALQNLYIPFSAYLSSKQQGKPLVVGINGSQGSGKSTLTRILSSILELGFNKTVVSFSIDDLYKTKTNRNCLARDIHPLLASRGVPGTHDIEMGMSIFKQLLEQCSSNIPIPLFDKAIDDRLPESHWKIAHSPCDIILFEGWCVGSIAEDEDRLKKSANSLELQEDEQGVWRHYVNQQLAGAYAELFSFIDILVMLKIPDFKKVYEWRKLQEHKLKLSRTHLDKSDNKIMSDAELNRFIMHYERISRHSLSEMPGRADIVLQLGENHQIEKVQLG